MENDTDPDDEGSRAAARHSLDAISADREGLARRLASAWWYNPAGGLMMAVVVGSPGAETRVPLAAFACLGMVFLELARRRVTGFSVMWPAGPQGVVLAIVMLFVILGLLATSFILVNVASPVWVLAPAAAAFVTVFAGGLLYDRVHATELRDVRE